MSVEGHRAADGEDMQAFMNALSPGYFETMKIPLLEGRDFRRADYKPNANVAIVNQRFAEHFFKGASADRQAARPGRRSDGEAERSRSSASSPTRSTKDRAKACAGRSSSRTTAPAARRSTSGPRHRRRPRTATAARRGPSARRVDAGLRAEDRRGAARRDAADRSADRAALRRLRSAGDGAGVGRPLRRHGVRRRAAQEGARHPPRARRATGAA